jgi:hypothetical protein
MRQALIGLAEITLARIIAVLADDQLRILLDMGISYVVIFAVVDSIRPVGIGAIRARGFRADGLMAPFGPP